jgi:hypothetical protein
MTVVKLFSEKYVIIEMHLFIFTSGIGREIPYYKRRLSLTLHKQVNRGQV